VRAFLAYLMRGRAQAITASAVCAAGSLLLMMAGISGGFSIALATLLSYVSGAVIGLATLRNGPGEGGFVVAGTVLLASVFTVAMLNTPYPVMAFALGTWIPAWILASLLGRTNSQGSVVSMAALLGGLAILGVHLILPDPATWWLAVFEEAFVKPLRSAGPEVTPEIVASLEQAFDTLAPVMTGLVVTATFSGLMLTLFLARWWHSILDNPGGFGKEFRSLRLDRGFAVAGFAVVAATTFANAATGGLAGDLLTIVGFAFALQGLAMVHGVVALRGAKVGWLVALYLMVSVMPHMMLLFLALVGFSDSWLDVRGRVARRLGAQ